MKIILAGFLGILMIQTVFLSNQFISAHAASPQRFFVDIDGEFYGLRYNITNAVIINDPTSDENQKTIMIEIRPNASGKLSVELPRIIIDSKAGDMDNNTDVPFVVTLHEKSASGANTTTTRIVTANETFTNKSFRNLDIDFSKDTYMISIAGTLLVPEFDVLPILTAGLSMGGLIFAFRFSRTLSRFLRT